MLLGYISDMNAEFGFQLPHKGYAKQLVKKGKEHLSDKWAKNAEIESGFHRVMRGTEPGPTPPKWNAGAAPKAPVPPNTDVQRMAHIRKLAMNGDQEALARHLPRAQDEQLAVIERAGRGSLDVAERGIKDMEHGLSEPSIAGITNPQQVFDVINERRAIKNRRNKRGSGGGEGLLVGGGILGAAALGGVGTNRRRERQ